MPDTLFTKIINREIPAQLVHEDDLCVAFRDIHPQSPTHILIVPRKSIANIGAASPEDQSILGHLLLTAAKLAKSEKLDNGYRLVLNNGRDAGESVPHLHLHLLGGRPLNWPPG
jgi:histidine triad (HIT) family protein